MSHTAQVEFFYQREYPRENFTLAWSKVEKFWKIYLLVLAVSIIAMTANPWNSFFAPIGRRMGNSSGFILEPILVSVFVDLDGVDF